MKKCTKCGGYVPDGNIFCLSCGSIVSDDAPMVSPEEIPSPVPDSIELAPEPITEGPITAPIEQKQPKKKKRKVNLIWKILAAVGVLAIIAFLIIGYVTNWFGGPLGGLYRAFNRTIKAENFNLKLELFAEYTGGIGTNSTQLLEDISAECKVAIDRENEVLTLIGQLPLDDHTARFMIHDGMVYTIAEKDGIFTSVDTQELPQETLDAIFDILNGEHADDEKLEQMLEQYGIDASVEEFRAFTKTLERECFTNREWLEKYLGYEKKDNRYCFDIDLNDLAEELIDRAYDEGIITKTQKKEWTATKLSGDVELEFEVDGGYVTMFEMVITDSYIETGFSLEFSDINKCEITDDEINEFKAEVDEYSAVCVRCGKKTLKSNMAMIDGNFYCSTCSTDIAPCCTCGIYGYKNNMSYLNSKYYCETCFEEYSETHRCDHCLFIVSENGICYSHQLYGYCDECGFYEYISHYDVINHKFLCYTCFLISSSTPPTSAG